MGIESIDETLLISVLDASGPGLDVVEVVFEENEALDSIELAFVPRRARPLCATKLVGAFFLAKKCVSP